MKTIAIIIVLVVVGVVVYAATKQPVDTRSDRQKVIDELKAKRTGPIKYIPQPPVHAQVKDFDRSLLFQ